MKINKYITSINNQVFKPGKNTSAATGFIKSPGNSGRSQHDYTPNSSPNTSRNIPHMDFYRLYVKIYSI